MVFSTKSVHIHHGCGFIHGKQVLYEMIPLTCLAHGLHQVAEIGQELHPNVNRIICSIKKV